MGLIKPENINREKDLIRRLIEAYQKIKKEIATEVEKEKEKETTFGGKK